MVIWLTAVSEWLRSVGDAVFSPPNDHINVLFGGPLHLPTVAPVLRIAVLSSRLEFELSVAGMQVRH